MDDLENLLVDDNIVEILDRTSERDRLTLRLVSCQWKRCVDKSIIQKRPIHLLKEGRFLSMIKQVQNPTKWKTHPEKLLNEIARRAHVGLFDFIVTRFPTIAFTSAVNILTTVERNAYHLIKKPNVKYLDVKFEERENALLDKDARDDIAFIDLYRRRFRILNAMAKIRPLKYKDDDMMAIASMMNEHEFIYQCLLQYKGSDKIPYKYVIYLNEDQANECVSRWLTSGLKSVGVEFFNDIYSRHKSVGRKLAHLLLEWNAKRVLELYADPDLFTILNPIASAYNKRIADENLEKQKLLLEKKLRDEQWDREYHVEAKKRAEILKAQEQEHRDGMFTKIKNSLTAAIKARGEALPVSFGFTMDTALAVDFNRPWTFTTARTKHEITITRIYNL